MKRYSSRRQRSARALSPLYFQPSGHRGSLGKVEGEGLPVSDVYYGLLPEMPTIGTIEIVWKVNDYRAYSDRLAITEGRNYLGHRAVVATLCLEEADPENALEVHTGVPDWKTFVESDVGRRELIRRHAKRVGEHLLEATTLHTNRIRRLYEEELLANLPLIGELPDWDR